MFLTLSILKNKFLDLRHRQRRNKSKKGDEREETMGFSAMNEAIIKSKCLCILLCFSLNHMKHSDI